MAEKKKVRKDQDFLDLCEWLEVNIFDYDISVQRLQKDACLVLKGLQNGKAVANNNTQSHGNYPFSFILTVFKVNKYKIRDAIKNKTFESERQKMTYICTIIRDKINPLYTAYIQAKKMKEEKEELLDTSAMQYEGAEYQPSKRKNNKRLEGLW